MEHALLISSLYDTLLCFITLVFDNEKFQQVPNIA